MKRMVLIFLCVVMLFVMATGCSKENPAQNTNKPSANDTADEYPELTIRMGYPTGEGTAAHAGVLYFKELVEERSGGKIIIDNYPGGVLGNQDELIQQVIAGTLDSANVGSVSAFSGYNDLANIEDIPFLFASQEEGDSAMDGPFGDALNEQIIEPLGLTLISYWTNGMRHFTNNVRPIEKPEDMVGLKFRSGANPIRIEMFESFGAAVIPMSFSELFTALQQGTVDGQENPLSVITANNFNEVQKYVSLSGHSYASNPVFFNTKIFKSYPEKVQELLIACAEEAKVYERSVVTKQDNEVLENIDALGMTLSEIDRDAFIASCEHVRKDFVATYGDELLNLALKK